MVEKAVIYARISLDKSGEAIGVQRQLHDLRHLAELREYEVIAEEIDNDVSAMSGAKRPGFEKVWGLVRSGAVDHVLVWQTSRLMRSRADRAQVIAEFGKHRVDIVAAKGPSLDLRTAYGRGVADLMSSFDTLESEIKSERVAASIADLARRGKGWGYCPYGWDRVGRGVHATQVINESEAAVVVELVDRLLAGESLNELYRDMNRREIPAPGFCVWMKIPAEIRQQREELKGRKPPTQVWAKSTVRTLVVRDANAGILRHRHRDNGGTEMSGDWPAIVEPGKHARVVALLRAPERRSHTGERPGARRHLLTNGIGECGKCGEVLRVAKRTARSGDHKRLYICNGHGCTGRLKDEVDNLIKKLVIRRMALPDAVSALLSDDVEAQRLQDVCDDLQGRLDEAAVSHAAGRIPIRSLELITAELQPRLQEARRERDASLRGVDMDQLKPLIGPGAEDAWDAMGVNQRRAVLQTIGVEAVVLLPRKLHGPGFEADSVEVRWRSKAPRAAGLIAKVL